MTLTVVFRTWARPTQGGHTPARGRRGGAGGGPLPQDALQAGRGLVGRVVRAKRAVSAAGGGDLSEAADLGARRDVLAVPVAALTLVGGHHRVKVNPAATAAAAATAPAAAVAAAVVVVALLEVELLAQVLGEGPPAVVVDADTRRRPSGGLVGEAIPPRHVATESGISSEGAAMDASEGVPTAAAHGGQADPVQGRGRGVVQAVPDQQGPLLPVVVVGHPGICGFGGGGHYDDLFRTAVITVAPPARREPGVGLSPPRWGWRSGRTDRRTAPKTIDQDKNNN